MEGWISNSALLVYYYSYMRALLCPTSMIEFLMSCNYVTFFYSSVNGYFITSTHVTTCLKSLTSSNYWVILNIFYNVTSLIECYSLA